MNLRPPLCGRWLILCFVRFLQGYRGAAIETDAPFLLRNSIFESVSRASRPNIAFNIMANWYCYHKFIIRALKNAMRTVICVCFSVVRRIPKSDGILLTFDDGPDPNVTLAVLDLLRQYEAKAIFFICGRRIENAPEMLARIVAEGHVLGNHSFAHWKRPDTPGGWKEYANDLKKCDEAIAEYIPEPVKLFRAPH